MQNIANMHDWISDLPDNVAGDVLSRCTTQSLLDGESLWHPGDPANKCYRVKSGRLKVCNVSASGQEFVHTYILEGDCVGEWGLMLKEKRLNHTVATGATEVLALRKEDFYLLYDKYPEIPKALNLVFARRMRHFVMLAEDASLLPLQQRLARTILRIGHSSGFTDDNGRIVIENISHDELGRLVGATRQSVSRELKKLQDKGEIEINYGGLIISDVSALGEKYERLISVEPVAPGYTQCDE